MLAPVLRAALGACPLPLLALSGAAWLAIAAGDPGMAVAGYCGAFTSVPIDSWPRLVAALTLSSPSAIATQWLLMLAAMMPPLLADELGYIRIRTLARRRLCSAGLFVLGYACAWLAAGPVLVAAALALRVGAGPAAFAVALGVALAWQCSPARQACLNLCHRRPRLAAFGPRGYRDCLRFGLSAGAACCGTCWALMLATLAAETYHLPLMLLGAALMLAERQSPARVPVWRAPLPLLWRRPRAAARALAS